jgi:hypothetical protein
VLNPSRGDVAVFFSELQDRTARLKGDRENLLESGLVPAAGHRPFFVTRPVALWLERRLDLPNRTTAEIEAMPETHISEWAKARGVAMDPGYVSEEREGGTRALDSNITGIPREDLFVFSHEEWERRKGELIYESWIDRAKSSAESSP